MPQTDFKFIFDLIYVFRQGINTMSTRQVSIKIQLSEVPFVMRAMGFYPSEQEVFTSYIFIYIYIYIYSLNAKLGN